MTKAFYSFEFDLCVRMKKIHNKMTKLKPI